ncbi:hypothetical protein CG08_1555 [Riemerella anatipestifer]|uniref:Uncharacterized protein n=1 Tax=Riemerella anatipestifer (strain ATCC 11845 / DSM 15868 / JCM 9532 / NCTC 11014) TaxID=693978 RepID=H8MCP9_RIEAD|nr:hypothetical protein RA0C_1676 [Riemerella anatipestifer ATCC 11845 = DSM 15868]AGC39463.1 hypothetical protein G148_0158 [Riemerella anatipestifer RA-CH-2]AKP69745.1 hypothetical protein CG08_1555 [Riemerella anatipestifer]AKP71699.1 hypothetical protein CG09_1544 [Riemerella anatipestifer]
MKFSLNNSGKTLPSLGQPSPNLKNRPPILGSLFSTMGKPFPIKQNLFFS